MLLHFKLLNIILFQSSISFQSSVKITGKFCSSEPAELANQSDSNDRYNWHSNMNEKIPFSAKGKYGAKVLTLMATHKISIIWNVFISISVSCFYL